MAAMRGSPEAGDRVVLGARGGRGSWLPPPLRLALRRFLSQPAGTVGLLILLAFGLLAVAAPFLAPHGAAEQFPGSELRPPSIRFPLGTDNLGRDVLSRIVFGSRVSLVVGVVAVSVGAGLGGGSGLVAGYAGGWLDAVVMRGWDAVFAVPAILLGLA